MQVAKTTLGERGQALVDFIRKKQSEHKKVQTREADGKFKTTLLSTTFTNVPLLRVLLLHAQIRTTTGTLKSTLVDSVIEVYQNIEELFEAMDELGLTNENAVG